MSLNCLKTDKINVINVVIVSKKAQIYFQNKKSLRYDYY